MFFGCWRTIVRVFGLVKKVASLQRNVSKNQLLLLGPEHDDTISLFLAEFDGVSRDKFLKALKYLGVFIGPEAQRWMWRSPIAGFEETVNFIRLNVSGLMATSSLYNVLAHSKLAWTATFYSPPIGSLRGNGAADNAF